MKEEVNLKIAYLLERISQVFRVHLWELAKIEKLSPLQIQTLQYVKNRRMEERIPSRIAIEFGLTKATMSDAIHALIKKGLIQKIAFKKDRRYSVLSLTNKGKKVVNNLPALERYLNEYLKKFSLEERRFAFKFLLNLLTILHLEGHIGFARMCCSCQHFRRLPNSAEEQYICILTGRKFSFTEIKIDCDEYAPTSNMKGGKRLCC